MQLPAPVTLERADLAQAITELPEGGGIFLVRAGVESAYLAKTTQLRRRLKRVLPFAQGRKTLDLSSIATSVEYWQTASKLEADLLHYQLAKSNYPDQYLRLMKLRMPAYVKLILSNEFPRTQVTTRLGAAPALYYGPFRTRASAEAFENGFLEFFQLRRCEENLDPRPDHPGCIYGEMNMCLRPCQEAVNAQQYATETRRVADFLATDGTALLHNIGSARERLSEEMQFEDAARQHKRYERLQQVLGLCDDLVCDINHLSGIAVTPSTNHDAVRLWFVAQGMWQDCREFPLQSNVSLDQRLKELTAAFTPVAVTASDRQEHLALLARWRYSSWSDGEWIPFADWSRIPYRKLVKAISRTYQSVSG